MRAGCRGYFECFTVECVNIAASDLDISYSECQERLYLKFTYD